MYEASLAHAFGLAGKRAEASKILEYLGKMGERGFVSSYDLAIAHIGLGDRDKTFELLSTAVRDTLTACFVHRSGARFNGLRADPRFGELLRSIGLTNVNAT